MNYQEVHDIAHAIGFHRGRMRAAQDAKGIRADKMAFDDLLNKIPEDWIGVATRAHNDGITDGDTGPPAPERRTRGRQQP